MELILEEKATLQKIDWDFKKSTTDKLHSIHPYPAKFIPEIPRALLQTLSVPKGTLILDPFCGSGVTLTEAQRAGYESVGVDLNPIACLLSKVKTTSLSEDFMATARKIVSGGFVWKKGLKIPAIPNVDHWFEKDIQKAIVIVLDRISKVKNQDVKDALYFCLSAILVKISNQESDTRYAAINKGHRAENVFNYFLQAAEKLTNAKDEFHTKTRATVLNANSLLIKPEDFSKPVGMVITSPPYPNAYEYWLYHKYRMWWLGFDPINVKRNEIGARAHYFKKNHETINDFIGQMTKLFQFFSLAVVEGGYVCFVVGRSKIHGQTFENHKIIEKIGMENGFLSIKTYAREINPSRKSFNLSHARIKNEYIVILQKTN